MGSAKNNAWHCKKYSINVNLYLIPTEILCCKYYHLCFTDKGTEA